MLEWVSKHLVESLLGGAVLLFLLYKAGLGKAIKALLGLTAAIQAGQARLLEQTRTDLIDANQRRAELESALREKTRDCDIRDDINAQDRYEIRLLRHRLQEPRKCAQCGCRLIIDIEDIEEAVRKWKPPPR